MKNMIADIQELDDEKQEVKFALKIQKESSVSATLN